MIGEIDVGFKVRFICLISCLAMALAMTSGDQDLAIDSYNNAFYVETNSEVGYYVEDTSRGVPGREHFWQTCEQIEALEDAYERTNSAIYRGMISKLVNGLNQIVSGTTDWASWNGFNDDIMWGVIALARAYEMTGDSSFLSQAQIQFNAVWSRGWDNVLGGGLWWNTEKKSKNACVNFPATIAAMYLAKHTRNTGFRSQADQLWSWARANLYNASTGQVTDHKMADGTLSPENWAFTYNQGTFIGASYMLYQETQTSSYHNDCSLASTWTKNNLSGRYLSGILNEYNDKRAGDGDNDGPGFKGIFARWCSKYANGEKNSEITTWLTTNANSAWKFRNTAGVIWAQWWHRTPDTDVTSWECSSGLAITQNAP